MAHELQLGKITPAGDYIFIKTLFQSKKMDEVQNEMKKTAEIHGFQKDTIRSKTGLYKHVPGNNMPFVLKIEKAK